MSMKREGLSNERDRGGRPEERIELRTFDIAFKRSGAATNSTNRHYADCNTAYSIARNGPPTNPWDPNHSE
jgi:hypothetical protein